MDKQILGKVLITFRGEYKSGIYEKLDIVTYNGSSYVSKIDDNNSLPTSNDWQLIALKGTDGKNYILTEEDRLMIANIAGQKAESDFNIFYNNKVIEFTNLSEENEKNIVDEAEKSLGELNKAKENAINEISGLNNGLKKDVEDLKQNKVDKIEGKGLSENDYSNEEKEKLDNTFTNLNDLLADYEKYTDLESMIKRYCLLTRDGRVFGTHFESFSTSQNSVGTRTKANVGKYMTPATDSTPEETNLPDFLTKPLFTCNGHLDDDGNFHIDAIKGDKNFKDKGEVDVFNAYRTVYLKHTISEDGAEDYEISDSEFEGSKVIQAAIKKDGTIAPVFYVAKYQATLVNGKLYSSKGKPERMQCYTNCVTNYHKKGKYYCAMTDSEYMFFQFLFIIMFADRNNETKLSGNTNNNYQYKVSWGEDNINRVILTTSQANNIDLNTYVSVGNVGSNTNFDRGQNYVHNLLDDVKVIGKEEIDDTHIALILDCEEKNIPTGALVTTMHEHSGFSDYVLGNTGSIISNTNGRHAAVIAGTEILVGGYNVIGNMFSDIVSSNFTRDIYITNDASKLTNTVATAKSTYKKSKYQFKPPASTWKYITAMEYDLDLGISVFKSAGQSGSGSATGYCDAVTCDGGTSGQREVLRGGPLSAGGPAGLWCLSLYSTLSNLHWYFLSRPSVCALGGELPE